MISNTSKTVLGFFRSVLERRAPFRQKSTSVNQIYNYLPIDNLYATSGQPSEQQFEIIRDEGYETVINLAPTSVLENSIIAERKVLTKLGIEYIHISVDFKKPTEGNFDKFVSCLEGRDYRKVWVHCAANMRVSAFTYRYRCSVLGVDEKTAKNDLEKIWNPISVWRKFIHK